MVSRPRGAVVRLPGAGAATSLATAPGMTLQVDRNLLVGAAVVAAGGAIYALAPRERSAAASLLRSRGLMARQARARGGRFLGHLLQLLRRAS